MILDVTSPRFGAFTRFVRSALCAHRHLSKVGDLRDNVIDETSMNKEQVIAKLREHEPELKAAGIVRLAVFGSVARGDNSPQSDIDLLADFDKTKRYTLLTLGRIENRLADLLGTRVDLSSPEWLKESIRNQVLREAVDAF
jgi:predicted nucleotidyltransferase